MFDSPLSDFLSSNFSAAEAVIFIRLAPMSFNEDGFERKLTGCTKNPCRSPPAEVFRLRQMIF